MKHLLEEQKKEVNNMTESYREMCLDCFSIICGGKTIKKMEFPRPLLHGETALTIDDINQAIDLIVHHSFID
jgi:hypothetical protein